MRVPFKSAPSRTVLAGLSIPLLGWIDYATGYELAFSPFYFLPVAFAAWYGGTAPAVAATILCVLVWAYADFASGHTYSSAYLFGWNALIRLLSFLAVMLLVLDRRRMFWREYTRANSDSLTGLLNHRGFVRVLQAECVRAQRYGRPLSVAYLDLDNFKQVNDTAGHAAGDRVLKAVASSLRAELRGVDVAARLGGDEFAILLPEVEGERARDALHRIHRVLSAVLADTGYDVNVSIGGVTCSVPPSDAEAVLRAADENMYRVKHGGKAAILVAPIDAADAAGNATACGKTLMSPPEVRAKPR